MAKKDYSKLERDDLLRIIEKIESRKKYGLVWDEERTKEQFEKESENALPVLKEVKNKEILTDQKKPINILIEGDNYHALSVLNYTHQDGIDIIYIDPPYNTGTDDFKYNDNYVEKDDTYRHSKWLSFMSKRLRLAKNLLKETGLCFISIDENELYQLKLLCDSIFGEDNFLSNIKLKVKAAAGVGQESFLQDIGEYILVYARNYLYARNNMPNIEEPIAREVTNNYNKIFVSPGESKKIKVIKGGNVGDITVYKQTGFKIESIPTIKREMKVYYDNFNKIFRTTNPQGGLMQRIMPQLPKDGLVSFEYIPSKGRNKGKLHRSYFYKGALIVWLKDSAIKDDENNEIRKLTRQSNFWLENLHQGIASEGGVDFKNGKKPILLIKKLIQLYPNNENAVILDFFAGSGTTGHAVLDLNASDGGKRKVILCTNDENNVCSRHCLPRINNAINGYGGKKGLGGNLKYFKTAFVKKTLNSDQLKINMTNKCTEMLCLKEGIFDLVDETDDYKIFKQGDRIMAVYHSFLSDSLKEVKKKIDKLTGEKILYCFTLDPFGLDKNNFIGWSDIALEPIPQKILDVYEEIYEY